MRNADGQVDAEPARTPVVLYLSAEARELMRRHRDEAALAGAPPLVDSKLVEAALLAYMADPSKLDSKKRLAAAATEVRDASPPAARDEDIKRLRELRARIRQLNTKLEKANAEQEEMESDSIRAAQWTEVRETLLDRHRMEASLHLPPLASRLQAAFGELRSDAARMQALNEEVVEYLMTLLDKLERYE
jgi:TolA-binding protein